MVSKPRGDGTRAAGLAEVNLLTIQLLRLWMRPHLRDLPDQDVQAGNVVERALRGLARGGLRLGLGLFACRRCGLAIGLHRRLVRRLVLLVALLALLASGALQLLDVHFRSHAHVLCLSIRDLDEHHTLARRESDRVDDEVAAPFQLNAGALAQSLERRIADCHCVDHAGWVDDVLHDVVVLDLGLRHEVVELPEDHGRHLVVKLGHPMNFLLGVLDVAPDVQTANHARHFAILTSVNLVDVAVPPMQQRDLLTLLNGSGILLLNPHLLALDDQSFAQTLVLRVLFVHDADRLIWTIQLQQYRIVFADRGVTRHDWVNLLLVDSPNLVPLHQDCGLRHAERQSELKQGVHRHAAAKDALDRGEAGVVPALDVTFVHEPCELPLGQNRVRHLRLGKLNELHVARPRGLQDPLVHGVPVRVLDCSQRVRDALDRINARAREVVRRVRLVLRASLVVGRVRLASVEYRVPQALDFVGHVHLPTDAILQALRRAGEHLTPQPKVFLDRVLPPRALDPGVSL
mmetsp:Transcript_104984/g.321647  ORF Transcript_104984/g.321647 Transcript_104984/m.321647 type:complete len:517 (-) Transcript_104984:746-2296(-)